MKRIIEFMLLLYSFTTAIMKLARFSIIRSRKQWKLQSQISRKLRTYAKIAFPEKSFRMPYFNDFHERNIKKLIDFHLIQR